MVGTIQAEYKLLGVMKREGDWYVAHCPPLDITTQGRTEKEAKENLREAATLFMVSCIERGTLDHALRELGFVRVEKVSEKMPANAFSMTIPVPLRFQTTAPCPA